MTISNDTFFSCVRPSHTHRLNLLQFETHSEIHVTFVDQRRTNKKTISSSFSFWHFVDCLSVSDCLSHFRFRNSLASLIYCRRFSFRLVQMEIVFLSLFVGRINSNATRGKNSENWRETKWKAFFCTFRICFSSLFSLVFRILWTIFAFDDTLIGWATTTKSTRQKAHMAFCLRWDYCSTHWAEYMIDSVWHIIWNVALMLFVIHADAKDLFHHQMMTIAYYRTEQKQSQWRKKQNRWINNIWFDDSKDVNDEEKKAAKTIEEDERVRDKSVHLWNRLDQRLIASRRVRRVTNRLSKPFVNTFLFY